MEAFDIFTPVALLGDHLLRRKAAMSYFYHWSLFPTQPVGDFLENGRQGMDQLRNFAPVTIQISESQEQASCSVPRGVCIA
jgi:hypothetical protein